MPDYPNPSSRYDSRSLPPGRTASGAASETPGKRTLVEGIPNAPIGDRTGVAPTAASSAPGPHTAPVADRDRNASADQSPAAPPPDLGNYDSPVGKHVLVLRTWDDT